jgi:hypothetical protein
MDGSHHDSQRHSAEERYQTAKSEVLEMVALNPGIAHSLTRHLLDYIVQLEQDDVYAIQHTLNERLKIDQRIRNFDMKHSPAWHELKRRGWDRLSQAELLSIAQLLGKKLSIHVDREAKRRKNVLVKWFEENLSRLSPLLDCIQLVFEEVSPNDSGETGSEFNRPGPEIRV